jgi:TolA-binding protein
MGRSHKVLPLMLEPRKQHPCRYQARRQRDCFESAQNDYYLANYPLAIEGFKAYLGYYPKSDMADDALSRLARAIPI